MKNPWGRRLVEPPAVLHLSLEQGSRTSTPEEFEWTGGHVSPLKVYGSDGDCWIQRLANPFNYVWV